MGLKTIIEFERERIRKEELKSVLLTFAVIILIYILIKIFLFLRSKMKDRRITNELIKKLKPYFDAGVLTDTLYISNEFCIFNYGDMAYIGFPSARWPEYPIGMVIPPQHVESNIDNPLLFFEQFKLQVDTNFGYMCHFSEKNLDFYINNMEKTKETIISHIDIKLNERLKAKSEHKREIKMFNFKETKSEIAKSIDHFVDNYKYFR